MTIIEIVVEENTLKEAEDALNTIGMDVQIAVNIFLRRVAIEKGLPMSMSVPVSSQREKNIVQVQQEISPILGVNSNSPITTKMADEVWFAFLKYHKGLDEISRLKIEVSEKSGMNSGSAFIYLNILSNLVKGTPNTRNLKRKDLELYMDRIKSELGMDEYQNAINSLRLSLPYWKTKLAGSFADYIENNLNSIWKL